MPIQPSASFIQNPVTKGTGRLRPFADPVTKHEAAYFQDLHDKYDWQAIIAGILSYKRNAIEGLTVISFYYNMQHVDNKDKPRTFRLLSDFKRVFGSKTKDTKEFHTFFIPETFIKKIEEIDKISTEKNGAFFKQVFEDMNKQK